jgi:predicted RNA-binding Zn-ribbon protein involved in translation (DUF1610 family)
MSMGTICEACGYQRKPTDQAPDWQCPSCGKAYVKTMHDSHESVSDHAQSYPSALGTQRYEEPAYPQKPGGFAFNNTTAGNKKSGLVFGAVIGILVFFGIPILTNPSSASAILLHGEAGFLFISFIVIAVLGVVGKRLGAGIDPNDKMAKFKFFAKFFAIFCATLFILPAIWLRNQERTETKIQLNGQRVMADVVRIYIGACGKRSCSIDVEYAFTPTSETDASAQPVHGYAHLGSSNHPNDPDVIYARANKQVPIAYEVGHPEVSALNFDDEVFRIDHGERYRSVVALLGKILLGIFAVVLAVVGLSLWSNSSA